MFPMLKKLISKSYQWALITFDVLSIFIIAFEITVITGNVIMRYVFHNSLAWLDEFAGFGLIWMGFVISVRLMDEDEHFHVDVLVRRITSKFKLKIIYFFNYTLMIAYLAILSYWGIQLCYRLSVISPSYSLSLDWFPKFIVYLIIPLTSLTTIAVLIKKLMGQNSMSHQGD